MFGSFDGEFVCGVIVDHFRDGVEWRAVLAQDIAAVFGLAELHVHESLAAPQREREVQAAGLTVSYQITALLTEGQQRLGLGARESAVIPYLFLQGQGGIHSLSDHGMRFAGLA